MMLKERGWGKYHRNPVSMPESELRKNLAPYAVVGRSHADVDQARVLKREREETAARRVMSAQRQKENKKMLKEARRTERILKRSQAVFEEDVGTRAPTSYTQLHQDRNHGTTATGRKRQHTRQQRGGKAGGKAGGGMEAPGGSARNIRMSRRATSDLRAPYENKRRPHDLPSKHWSPPTKSGKVRRNNDRRG